MERVEKALGMEAAFCLSAYLTGRLSLAQKPNGLPLDMLVSSLPLSKEIRQDTTNNVVPLETLFSIDEKLERGEARDRRSFDLSYGKLRIRPMTRRGSSMVEWPLTERSSRTNVQTTASTNDSFWPDPVRR